MAFLLGHAALLFLACHIVLMFVIENIRAQEEMARERHGREPAGCNSTGGTGAFQGPAAPSAPVVGRGSGPLGRATHGDRARTAT